MEENYRNRFATEEEYNEWCDKYNGANLKLSCCSDITSDITRAFNETSCKTAIGGIAEDRKSLSVYNVVKNEDGSEGIGSLVAEFDYIKEKNSCEFIEGYIDEPTPAVGVLGGQFNHLITEEQNELYKEISQHLLDNNLIKFNEDTTTKKGIYKPENSPAPNWKKINFNKKRYKR